MQLKSAYIFVDPSVDATRHKVVIDTPNWKLVIQGVSTTEEGAKTAKQLVKEGVVLIELCGGFGYDGAKRVYDAVGDKVPVGMGVHQVYEAPRLAKVLRDWESRHISTRKGATPGTVMQLKSAYIFVDPSVDSTRHKAVIDTPNEKLVIQGVSTTKGGAKIAKQLVKEGVATIELCGGFGYDGAKRVYAAVGDKVPVGMGVHQVYDAPLLARVLTSAKVLES